MASDAAQHQAAPAISRGGFSLFLVLFQSMLIYA